MSLDTSGTSTGPTRCATHPEVETNLRCGKCELPICPRCLVFTPVGARCKTCANVRPLPTFQVGTAQYAQAVAGGLGAAVGGGIAWALIAVAMPFLSFWLVLGQGYLSGELVSRAANRKRGRGLRVIAVASVLAGYLLQRLILIAISFRGVALDPGQLVAIAIAQFGLIFANIMLLLVFAVAAYIAATRV